MIYKGLEDYKIIKELGRGTTSTVLLISKNDDLFAAKCFENNFEYIQEEVDSLKAFDHKNIIKFIDFISKGKNNYIITEYCNGLNLEQYIEKYKVIEESACKRIMRKIIKAVCTIHSKGYIHRDLKLANIYMCGNNINNCQIKLGDFGYCRQLDYDINICGTPYYMAPELLSCQLFNQDVDI